MRLARHFLVRQLLASINSYDRLKASTITVLNETPVRPGNGPDDMVDADVGTFQRPRQQAPKVLQSVCMDVTFDVLDGVIYNSMDVFRIQSFIVFGPGSDVVRRESPPDSLQQ